MFISHDAVAKSCKQKWAEYYAGKSWFKPFCDTEEYKQRQRTKKELENYYLNDGEPEQSRWQKSASKLEMFDFSYSKYEMCDSKDETCLNVYAKVINKHNDESIKLALFNCSYSYNVNNYREQTGYIRFYSFLAESGSIFFGDLKPGKTKAVQLYEGHTYYVKGKKIGRKNAKAKYSFKLPIPSNENVKLTGLSCSPSVAY